MNRSSLRLCVSIALAGSALMACVSATDSASDAEEATGRTQQALRYCPDGPCEPLPSPPKKPPTPPPSPWGQYTNPNINNAVTAESTYWPCIGGDLAYNKADDLCYHAKSCSTYREVSDPDAGYCVGLVYVSMVQCDFTRHLVCYGWQSCSCALN